jgi:Protein O-mannosyl-transferase TMEM260-like
MARAFLSGLRKSTSLPALVWSASFVTFALTAYPTITWWDASSYSLAAATLGITPPPGSLLLTLLGWLANRIPTGLPAAHVLNLLAAALAATTVVVVFRVALQLLRQPEDGGQTGVGHVSVPLAIGAAVGTLTFAFSTTLWEYAIQFTPYVLTTVFTALLLWTLLRWWKSATDPHSWRWILLLGLLFGLDYSVHRTNALLMPGALVWILIRQPRALRRARTWIAGVGGLLAGLLPQLLIIPLAARHPSLNIGDPSTWSRFYDYESLAQFGGGWLVQFYPRHAALWSVQVMDLLRAFGANFLWLSGRGRWAILGALPALLGVLGWLGVWRRDRRRATAFAALLVLHAACTVAFFNIPAHYFRSLDRHYLPVFVTWGVLVCGGGGEVALRLRELSRRAPWHAAQWAGALLLFAPLAQLAHNWRTHDGAHRTFAEDFAANLLRGLPSRAILFTWGDNDTFPLMYLQAVAHVRPDVQIVNVSLTNAPWYVDALTQRDPSFPLPRGYADSHGYQGWTDTTVVIPVAGAPTRVRLPTDGIRGGAVLPGGPVVGAAADFGLPEDLILPRSIPVHVAPRMPGQYILLQDLVVLQILEHNDWGRPLCFTTTANTPGLPGLAPYARLDGLFWRIVPYADPPASRAILRSNLLRIYQFRGYADPDVPLDEISRGLGLNYYPPLVALARAEYAAGGADRCRQSLEPVLRALPPARLQPDAHLRQEIEAACAGPKATRP